MSSAVMVLDEGDLAREAAAPDALQMTIAQVRQLAGRDAKILMWICRRLEEAEIRELRRRSLELRERELAWHMAQAKTKASRRR